MLLAGIILVSYRLRLHRLTQQLNLRFEERLAERTRIAQELHDTLLQGFLSVSIAIACGGRSAPRGFTCETSDETASYAHGPGHR
jgi:signal transduction histidine kinase